MIVFGISKVKTALQILLNCHFDNNWLYICESL